MVDDLRSVMLAAGVAGLVSGAPSTVWTLATGGDLLASTAGAGTLVLGSRRRRTSLAGQLAAGALVHAAISTGWAVVLARVLPGRPSVRAGAAAGLGIAALDLGVIGRRIPAIAALSPVPQVLDHVAYGVAVAAVLRWTRR